MKAFLKKHIKLWIFLIILIVIVIVGVVFLKKQKAKMAEEMASRNVQETAQVERRELVSSIAANGTIVASDTKDVTVNLSGVEFATIDVEKGDEINEGDLICTFDTSTINMQISDLEKQISASEASASLNVSQAQRMLAEAEASRDVNAEQADIDIANAWQDYLRSLTDVETAEDKYKNAQETTQIKNGELSRVEDNASSLENAEIEFATVKQQFTDYMNAKGIMAVGGATSSIAIGTDTWSGVSATTNKDNPSSSIKMSDFLKADGNAFGEGDEEMAQINKYLSKLWSIHANYTAYISGASVESDLSTWNSKAESAENSEESAKTSYENAIKTAQNYYRTYEQKLRDKSSTNTNSDSTIASKQDSLKSAQISASTTGLSDKEKLASYKDSLDKYQVYAPIGGTITAVNFEVGQSYGGTNAIVTIENQNSYQVSAEIEEYDIGRVKIGQDVVIKTNGTGDEELQGKIVEIADHATSGSTSSTTTYNVKIDILTKNDELKMDMTAKVSIVTDKVENALTVPYDAVQTDDEGNDYVEVVDETMSASVNSDTFDSDSKQANGNMPTPPSGAPSGVGGGGKPDRSGDVQMPQSNTKRVYITRGAESDYYIEVASEELKEGDTVVVVSTESNDLNKMMGGMGPMGGF